MGKLNYQESIDGYINARRNLSVSVENKVQPLVVMDFIEKLWEDANSHVNEVAHLAKIDEKGNSVGVWGAMSDLSK